MSWHGFWPKITIREKEHGVWSHIFLNSFPCCLVYYLCYLGRLTLFHWSLKHSSAKWASSLLTCILLSYTVVTNIAQIWMALVFVWIVDPFQVSYSSAPFSSFWQKKKLTLLAYVCLMSHGKGEMQKSWDGPKSVCCLNGSWITLTDL